MPKEQLHAVRTFKPINMVCHRQRPWNLSEMQLFPTKISYVSPCTPWWRPDIHKLVIWACMARCWMTEGCWADKFRVQIHFLRVYGHQGIVFTPTVSQERQRRPQGLRSCAKCLCHSSSNLLDLQQVKILRISVYSMCFEGMIVSHRQQDPFWHNLDKELAGVDASLFNEHAHTCNIVTKSCFDCWFMASRDSSLLWPRWQVNVKYWHGQACMDDVGIL